MMKRFFLLLCLLPLAALAQTAHVEDERVVYRQRITVNNAGQEELYLRAKEALRALNLTADSADAGKGLLIVHDKMRLSGMHSLRNFMQYELRLQVRNGGYDYRIDSVAWIQDARGEKLEITPSKKLVENMEVTGPTAARTEKQLNEIDMRIQKLLVLLDKAMRTPIADR